VSEEKVDALERFASEEGSLGVWMIVMGSVGRMRKAV
jgi:hypothetical protein